MEIEQWFNTLIIALLGLTILIIILLTMVFGMVLGDFYGNHVAYQNHQAFIHPMGDRVHK